MTEESEKRAEPKGVWYGRIAGRGLGLVLLVLGGARLFGGAEGFELFAAAFFILYGAVLELPFARLPSEAAWKRCYAVLVLATVAFVFVMIASVMFDYMAAAERGERLGVPGWQGTLIFLALLQVPVVLFARRPDLLD